MKVLAIIPARGGSKRLPGKNIKPFLGVPLIGWSIRFARSISWFARIVVSTDSPEIAAACAAEGLPVTHLRPAHLATDTASSVDVALQVLEQEAVEGRIYDLVALLQPTSPMRLASRWTEALALIQSGVDAVIGVAPAKTHPFHTFRLSPDGGLQPFHDRDCLKLRGQDLPDATAVAGNLYLVRTEALLRERTFFPARSAGILCDEPFEAVDIDEELDWVVAEAIAARCGVQP